MLILTRRVQESFRIDDDIVISVLGVKGNQVRVGIEAPADVKIYRDEIYRKMREGLDSTVSGEAKPKGNAS